MRRLSILGVPVDAVTQTDAMARIAAAITDGTPCRVATVNPEFVMRARRDRAFADVLRTADLCLPDGAGMLWAARRLGDPLPARVTGIDLVRALAARGAATGWRFFFLGAGPGIADAAATALRQEFPGLQVAGAYAGSPAAADETAIISAVRAGRADILLVAFGAPAQDLWIAKNLEHTGARVAIGVGGAFDFLSGRARRAPPWMRERGLEWLHRLAREPWRWRRMLALPQFAWHVLARSEG